jgi:hypothetical protein
MRDLNLAVGKLTNVQVAKLPLWLSIRKLAMICFAKPVLTEDLAIRTLDERSSIFIRENPIFSSERMLHEENPPKCSVNRMFLVVNLRGIGAKTN